MQGDRPSRRTLGRWLAILGIAATTGCVGSRDFKFRGTTALSFLRTIEESKDPNVRYTAYDSLSSPRCYDDEAQKDRAARTLVERLKNGHEPNATRAVICRTLGMLRRPESREAILGLIDDEDNLVRVEACRALGRVGRPEDSTILARVMTVDVSAECRVAAIESLGELKAKDRRIHEFLISGMEHEEPAIRVASMNALKSITGKDLGVDPLAWKKYVETLPAPGNPPGPGLATPAPATSSRTAPPDDGIR